MNDLDRRLSVYRLSYSSHILAWAGIIAFVGLTWLDRAYGGSWTILILAFLMFVGLWVSLMFADVVRLLKDQDRRLERLEELIGRLQEGHSRLPTADRNPQDEQRETP